MEDCNCLCKGRDGERRSTKTLVETLEFSWSPLAKLAESDNLLILTLARTDGSRFWPICLNVLTVHDKGSAAEIKSKENYIAEANRELSDKEKTLC